MSRFVCFSVLVLLAAVAVSSKPQEDYDKEHIAEVAEECKTESGATDEDVEHMMQHEPADSHESKCLRACMLKKFEIMNDEGKLSKENALEMVKLSSKDDAEKEAAATEIVDKCEGIEVPEDHCDAAAAYEKCIIDHMHEHGLALE
ncbi:PREDICTED: general odorant-binding protein 19d [Drosophila arizonae]|uniref:General odorant-binding protein 19d n=1 Tax=Drosophila arizonae TaxID=7263 RepID=A0ABM1PZI9_DROAR|nr:PREDICTED: general odorant-binding protein 19d [Drosophila arizonae]